MKDEDIAKLLLLMTPAPWTLDDDTPSIYSGELEVAVIGDEAQNYDGDGRGIVALRNHASAWIALQDAVAAWRDIRAGNVLRALSMTEVELALETKDARRESRMRLYEAARAVEIALAAVEAIR